MTQTTKANRKIPQRTCIACRQAKDKGGLIRVVRLPDGKLDIDPRGKLAGRGAYICAKSDCWDICFSGNRLEYILKINIAPQERERLLAEGRSLIGGG